MSGFLDYLINSFAGAPAMAQAATQPPSGAPVGQQVAAGAIPQGAPPPPPPQSIPPANSTAPIPATNGTPPGGTPPTAQEVADAHPQQPTDVKEVVVEGQRKPLHYDNSKDVAALHDSQGADAPIPGGTPGYDPGLWSVMPQSWRHGTLRNVLGGLGDAFLMMDHRNPTYRPRMEQQLVGNAMAGYANNPQAAIERVAATGVPGSDQMAVQMENAYQQRKMREASLAQTNQWHEDTLEQRRQYQSDQTARQQQLADDRKRQLIYGMLRAAAATGDQAKFSDARARALKMIPQGSGIDPSEFPENMGDFQAGYGLTANQGQVSADRAAQRGVSTANSIRAAGARTGAASISAGRPSTASIDQQLIDKQNHGIPLTPAEQAYWNHRTTSGRAPRQIPASLQVGGSNQGGAQTPYNPQTGRFGPPPAAVQMLRQNPGMRGAFEAKYGRGSAAQYLGR